MTDYLNIFRGLQPTYLQELIDKKFNKTEYLKPNLMWDETFEVSMHFSKPLEFSCEEKRFVHALDSLLQIAYDTYLKLYSDYDLFQPRFVIYENGHMTVIVALKHKIVDKKDD